MYQTELDLEALDLMSRVVETGCRVLEVYVRAAGQAVETDSDLKNLAYVSATRAAKTMLKLQGRIDEFLFDKSASLEN